MPSPSVSGLDAVLYQSFDSPDGLVLMERSELVGSIPLVSGQVTLVTFLQTYLELFKVTLRINHMFIN